jgi:hypothetical protein
MATFAPSFAASFAVAVALMFIMELGEPKAPAKQIIYFAILVISLTVGWAVKRLIQRRSAAKF